MPPTPSPGDVNWQALSPRERELLQQVGLRIVHEKNYTDIADELNAARPALRHVELPVVVTNVWVSRAVDELRFAIAAAASTMTTMTASWSTSS
jgi:hypothetical protein